MSEEQLDRRELLMQAMDAAEEGTLEAPEEVEINEPETNPIVEANKAEEQVETEVSDEDNEEPAEISAEHQSEEQDEAHSGDDR